MAHIAFAKVHVLRAMVLQMGELFQEQRTHHFIELIQAGAFIKRHVVNLIDSLRAVEPGLRAGLPERRCR